MPLSKQLLLKYLEGFCSPEEKIQIEELLKLPESAELFQEVLDEQWAVQNNFDKNDVAAWHAEGEGVQSKEVDYYARFRQRYLLNEKAVKRQKPLKLYQYLQYAAIFFLCASSAFYLIRQYFSKRADAVPIAYVHRYNPRGQRSIITLPDSSIAYLGPESHLVYMHDFNGKTREVGLDGEAFFEVKHKSSQPFIVNSNGLKTVVLGTSFKVEAYRPNQVTVSVATGKVSVGRQKKESLYHGLAVLEAGQGIVYNTETDSVNLRETVVKDLLTWKNGGLVFRDMTLAEICGRLELAFNTKIVVADGMKDFRMSSSFENVNLNQVLNVITETSNMKYTIKNHIIYLKKQAL